MVFKIFMNSFSVVTDVVFYYWDAALSLYAILRNFRWIRLKPDWLEFLMFEFYALYA